MISNRSNTAVVLLAAASLIASTAAAGAHSGEDRSLLPFGLQAEHLHLLTNHIPIFVTLSGLIVMGLSLFWKDRSTRRAGLVLILLGTTGGIATYWLGEQAYKHVRGLADEIGQDWLDLHLERADNIIWLFWLAAVAAVAALIIEWKMPRWALLSTLLATALAAATLGASGWIADAGGKIRHTEIRGASVPVQTDSQPASTTTENNPNTPASRNQ